MLEPIQEDVALRCTQCSFETVWSFQLDHHIRRNHTNSNIIKLFYATTEPELYYCVYCNFNNHHTLRVYEHYKTHHNSTAIVTAENCGRAEFRFEMYLCDCCEYKGQSSLCLAKHHVSCSEIIKVVTDVDSVGSDRMPALDSKASTGRFQCAECSYKCKVSSHLRRHKLVHARAEEIRWFHCNKCSYRAKLKRLLKAHVDTHAAPEELRWFDCVKCSYRATIESNLKKHYLLTHAKNQQVDWFVCMQCSFRTKHAAYLKSHAVIHAPKDDAWLGCDKCSYQTKDKVSLNKHVVRHRVTDAPSEGVKRFHCALCPYRAKMKRYLKEHMLRHAAPEAIAWFNCAKCAHRSKTKRSLKNHMLTHAPEDDITWFSCTECAYRAKRKAQLQRHMMSRHSTAEERTSWLLYCDQCTYSTVRSSDLKRHNLATHELKDNVKTWFDCDREHCSYRAVLKSYLTQHMRKHHSDETTKQFCCGQCEYRTKSAARWRRHVAKHKKVQKVTRNSGRNDSDQSPQPTENKYIRRPRQSAAWLNCDECNFRAKEKATLEKHKVLKHTAASMEWFNCDYCPFVTNEESSLNEHVKAHVLKATKSTSAATAN